MAPQTWVQSDSSLLSKKVTCSRRTTRTARVQSMRRSRYLFLALSLMVAAPAWAGPTIIRDSRVKDLATTPVLGRGYSLSTNTFQSTCLKDVVVTEPSYDFQYLFKETKASDDSTSNYTGSAGGSYSSFWISATVQTTASSATSRQKFA